VATIPAIQPGAQELQDEEVVRRVLAGETAMFEILMRRYNQRLYRVARVILRNDGEAEDVMQDAYVRAYQHLDQFAGKAAFATWLTRIAVHEALARKRRRERLDELDALGRIRPRHRRANCWKKLSKPCPKLTAPSLYCGKSRR